MKRNTAKRFIVSVLTAAIMTAAMPTMAQNGIDTSTYETYIDRVRVCFDLPEDLPNVNINQYDENVEISWLSDDNNRNYSASIDDHGCIRSFYSYSSLDEEENSKKITKQQAIEKAESVLKAVYGDKAASFERTSLNINSYSVNMYYRYTQNGLPVDAGVSIGIRRADGGVNNFSGVCDKILNYSYAKPESVKLLTDDEIYANYKESENIGIFYNIFYDENGDKYTKPVYIITPKNINASTGEEVTPQSMDDYEVATEEAAMDSDNGAGASTSAKRVTEFEKKAVKEFENLITKETADQNIKKYFPQIKGYSLENSSITTYNNEPKISLSYKDKESKNYANAELDAQTGDILHFGNYKYNNIKDKDVKFDAKKIGSLSDELVGNIAADIYNGKDFKKNTDGEHGYVVYERIHDGIKVNGQNVTVSFNDDLTFSDYRKTWDKLDFPSAKNAVAEKSIFEKSKAEGFGLKYVITENAAVLSYGYYGGNSRYYRVWRNESYYDALTGEKINPYDGTPQIENEGGNYTDLEGSPYKQTIETLAEYGYKLPYSEFKPNEYITVEDFYSFINTNIIYTDYIANKLYYGGSAIYSEAESKNVLTKYDIAKIFVNESNYTELAKKDIFKCAFTDVSEENAGFVTIASAMGFVPEKGGEFNGTKKITRGEAAEYIYKCLEANNAL